MPASFIDESGAQQEVSLSPHIYKAAADANLTVPQFINRSFPTSADATASTFEQLCLSTGLLAKSDKEFGLKTPTLSMIFDGRAELRGEALAATTADANPASRILFPAVVLEMIESKLAVDRTTDPSGFDRMVAQDISVTSNRMEQPVINLTNAEVRSQAVSQLAPPKAMLSITTADTSRNMLPVSIGMEVSDQALAATTLDFVSLVVARQLEVERNARVYDYMLGFLNGDADNGQSGLATTNADVYDSTIAADGVVTKTALVKWLMAAPYKRKISHIVTDINGALAIEAAMATTNTNQFVPGALVPQFSLMNRMLEKLEIFVVDPDAGWTANTLMGLDSRYAIARVRNSAAAYSAVEEFVLRRSKALRFDFSEMAYRLFDESFSVMTLINT